MGFSDSFIDLIISFSVVYGWGLNDDFIGVLIYVSKIIKWKKSIFIGKMNKKNKRVIYLF